MVRPSGLRLSGDFYQHLYSWYEVLHLLDDDSSYALAFVEARGAGSADDLVLHPKPELTEVPIRYIQVKWHSRQKSVYSFESILAAKPGEQSLLSKLFESWKWLPRRGPIEIYLVSNGTAEAETLGRYLKESYALTDDFYAGGPRSIAGGARKQWREHLGAEEDEMTAFLKDLRFCLGLGSLLLEKMVDDSMRGHGLQTGRNPRDLCVAEVSDWIKQGTPQTINRDVLLEAISRRKLKALKKSDPKICLYVHAWSQEAFPRPAIREIDWTTYYNWKDKVIADQRTWEGELYPQFLELVEEVNPNGVEKLIEIDGKIPVTVALALGNAFPKTRHFTLQTEQFSPYTNSSESWRSDAFPSERRLDVNPLCKNRWSRGSDDLLVGLCITTNASEILEDLCKEGFFGALKAAFVLQPDGGASQKSLRGDRDACTLAIETKTWLQAQRNEHRTRRIHLVPIAPVGFCLFLGQYLTALGEIVTYERDSRDRYQRSIVLRTG